jgi:acid phosphatase family membrane protein YuiD
MNNVIKAALLSWFVAQGMKVLFELLRYGLLNWSRLTWRAVWAGGMPSAHSALVASSALAIFLSTGPNNPVFGFSLIMACIVVYDRSRMYAIYRILQKKFSPLQQAAQNDPIFKDLLGHRFSEIIVGIMIGIGCGLAVFSDQIL